MKKDVDLSALQAAIESGDFELAKKLMTPQKEAVAKKAKAVKKSKAATPQVVTPQVNRPFGNGTNSFDPDALANLPEIKAAAKFDAEHSYVPSAREAKSEILSVVCKDCKQSYQISSKIARKGWVCDNCVLGK